MSEDIKVGEGVYSPRGMAVTADTVFAIVASPRLKGERWVSIAPLAGGAVFSYPEAIFDEKFRRVE